MYAFAVLFLFLFAGITAAEEQTAEANLSATPQNKQIIERYHQILIRFPKRGVSFDKVFNSYSERNCVPLLIEYCIRQKDSARTLLETANAEILLGLVYERLNERQKAAECFAKAAESDKTTPTAAFYLAENLTVLEKYKEAETALKTALQRNPNRIETPAILCTLGFVLNKLKKYEASITVLQQALKLEPDNKQISALLAEGYIELKHFDRASEIIRQLDDTREDAEEKRKIIPLLLEKLSERAEQQNDLSAAIQYQENLCRQFGTGKFFNRLLTLYVKNGDKEKAYQLFFNLVLSAGSVSEQTGYILKMLAAGQFQSVDKVLDFLEIHQEPNRQIDICRLLLEYFRSLQPDKNPALEPIF